MQQITTIKAELLPSILRQKLHANPQENIDIIEENNEIKLKKQLMTLAEEVSAEFRDDFEEIGVIDDESALEYFYNFRHGQN